MSRIERVRAMGAVLLAVATVMLVSVPGAWAASNYKALYNFTDSTDGDSPAAGLIFDRAGNVYGKTVLGGASENCSSLGCGTVFKLSPNSGGWTESVLYSFGSASNGSDGIYPYATLVFDQTGNLYGTTSGGGANGTGIVFELAPNGSGTWTESVLYSFCGSTSCTNESDGSYPYAGLAFDVAGNLYGTTLQGGIYGEGTVFELTSSAGGWTEKILHSFAGGKAKDGSSPSAPVILDALGSLYGTTMNGGHDRYGDYGGTVFQLKPNADGSWTERDLQLLFPRGL
jgi:uncharacterized repeat protein (TIGR03803 family)